MALDDGRAVIEFMTAAINEKPIPVFGDGSQTRSFCYVSDLVEGIVLAMDSDNTKGQIFNLGNPEEFSILELANKIKLLTNTKSEIVFAEKLPQDDPLQRCPDITRSKDKIGWEPKIKLDEGLKKLYEYLKK